MINIKKNFDLFNKQIEKTKPIILIISNTVSLNDVVNVCSYLNAIPVVSNDLSDAKKIMKNANALLVNTGTINNNQLKIIKNVYKIAKKDNKIIIVDPVGYSISKIRTTIINKILNDNYSNVIIKGNYKEICKMVDNKIIVKSVNNNIQNKSLSDLKNIAKEAYKKFNKHFIMTGENDIYCYKNELYIVKNGNNKMQLISGTGCMLGAAISAFCSISKNITTNAILAILLFNIAGENAFKKFSNEINSAKNEILDNLSVLLKNSKYLEENAKVNYENR